MSSVLPYLSYIIITLFCLGLAVVGISGVIECNKLCDESRDVLWVCRRDFWSCEVKYLYYIKVVFPLVMIVFGILCFLGFIRMLFLRY